MKALLFRFERVIRYVVVGGGVTLVYTLVTVGLISGHVFDDPTLASAVASLVTIPLSFIVHRKFTYGDAARDRGQWERFAVIASSNFLIATLSMKAVDSLHWPFWIALVFGWIVIPIVNYTINAIWVFRTKTFLSLHRDERG